MADNMGTKDEYVKQSNEQINKQIEIDRLVKETTRLEKEIKKLKNSRTFKYSFLFQVIFKVKVYVKTFFNSSGLLKENQILKSELLKKEYRLEQQEQKNRWVEKAVQAIYDDNDQMADYFNNVIKQEGYNDYLQFIQSLNKAHLTREHQLDRLLERLARTVGKINEPELKNHLYEQTAYLYKKARLPEYLIRRATENDIALNDLDSFSENLVRNFRKRQMRGDMPEVILDDKKVAYDFVKQLGFSIPKQSNAFTLDALRPESNMTIKPIDSDGGRGVYLVYSPSNIYDIKRERKIADWNQLVESMKEDLSKGWVKEDKWFKESLLSLNEDEPARDLKFYSFYGHVALILEVKRSGKTTYCWWDSTGAKIDTGKYQDSLFNGIGVTADEIKQVSHLSKHIPVPFMRIDFLRTSEGLVFGEFTPKPGHFDKFNDKTDQMLGERFLTAEADLVNDLLHGKCFEHYLKIVSNV